MRRPLVDLGAVGRHLAQQYGGLNIAQRSWRPEPALALIRQVEPPLQHLMQQCLADTLGNIAEGRALAVPFMREGGPIVEQAHRARPHICRDGRQRPAAVTQGTVSDRVRDRIELRPHLVRHRGSGISA